MASFWESFNGHNPMKFYTFTPEIRYHFKEKYDGFYVGAHWTRYLRNSKMELLEYTK